MKKTCCSTSETEKRKRKPPRPPITILIDTREQTPLDFTPYCIPEDAVKRTALPVGDYSIEGMESIVVVERKSLNDFLSSFYQPLFKNRLVKMMSYPRKYLVVEAMYEELLLCNQFSSFHPNQIKGAIWSIMGRYGIPIIFARNSKQAAEFIMGLFIKIHDEFSSSTETIHKVRRRKSLSPRGM